MAVVEGAVGEEGFAGGFFEEDLVVAEKVVDSSRFSSGDEEDLAFACAPGFEELVVGEEDGGASGKVEPKSMEVDAAFDEQGSCCG